MDRELWTLYQYSSVYGAPTIPVAVLGIEHKDGDTEAHVEWLGQEHGGIWPERLASTGAQDLPTLLSIWQHDTTALAAPVDELGTGADLVTAVRGHCEYLTTVTAV